MSSLYRSRLCSGSGHGSLQHAAGEAVMGMFSSHLLSLETLGNDSWRGGQAGGWACRDSESPPFAGVQEHEGVWVLSSTIRIWELGA